MLLLSPFTDEEMCPGRLNNMPNIKTSVCVSNSMKIPEIQILFSGPPHCAVYDDQLRWKEVYQLNKEGGEDDIDFSEGENVRETKDETEIWQSLFFQA